MGTLLTSLAGFVSWHRRAVAALLAAGAVLLFASAIRAPEPTVPVAVLTTAVPAGHELTSDDVTVRELPPDAVTPGAITEPADAVGQTTAVALGTATVLQRGLLGGALTADAGRAIVPIAIADESLRGLLRPGDPVSLVAPGPEGPQILTGDARIVALPTGDESGSRIALASGRSSGMVLVDVAAPDAGAVASLGQADGISIVLGSLDPVAVAPHRR